MTDRDFKLLVREYFQTLDMSRKDKPSNILLHQLAMRKLEEKIRAELSRSTQQEIEELPFKD